MGSIDDTRIIGEAWARATSLSADGQLQQAIMAFLRLRETLQDQKRKLQFFDDVPVGLDGLPRAAPRGRGAAAQATAISAGDRKGAGAVVEKLLSKVDEELRSHLQFLQDNPYAALQLPLPCGAGSTASNPGWEITDALVKNNYRRLALRFHPDKAGGTDSSPLFVAIRTAYETLATSRGRALHKAVPADDGDAAFCWTAEVGAASIRRSTGAGFVAATASGQGSSTRSVKEPRPGRWASREERSGHRRIGSGSNDALPGQTGFCREDSAAGYRQKPGDSQQGLREARDRDAQQKEDPGNGDTNEHQQHRQEKGDMQECAPVGVEGQGDGLEVEDLTGRQEKGAPKGPSVVPTQIKGHGKKQHLDQEHAKESQRVEGKKKVNEVVGSKFTHPASVDTDRFLKAPRHKDSSPAPFAGDGGAHRPVSPFSGRQKPRQQPCHESAPGKARGGAHQGQHTRAPAHTGSPLSPPSQAMGTASDPCRRASTQPRSKETVVSNGESVSTPSVVVSSSASPGERNERRGHRIVEFPSVQGLFRAHGLEGSSGLGDEGSSSGFSDDEGGAYNGGGGCVRRLRESVTARGRDPYRNATACSSPTYAYELQKEVDFWISGARRERVSRKQGSVSDDSTIRTVAEDCTPISVGSISESLQETLGLLYRCRRGQVLPPESGGDDDAVDRLVRATCTMSCSGVRKGDLFDRNSVHEQRTAAEAAPAAAAAATAAATAAAAEIAPHSFDEVEIGPTAVDAGVGRGWFWGAAT